MKNNDVVQLLNEMAVLLEIQGTDKFKPKAYSRAARSIASLGEDIEAIAARGELTGIPGVGKSLADKIDAYLKTGSINQLEQLRKEIPVKVRELDAIPGVGPMTMKLLYENLGITDLESLEKAVKEGQLKGLKGIGQKTVDQISEGIQLARAGFGRTLLANAFPIVEGIQASLREIQGVRKITIAGSFRRRKETIGDIDVLVVTDEAEQLMNAFVHLEGVADVLAHGPTKSSVRLASGIQVDVRVLPADSYGAGLQYFTGSIDHNVHVRTIAQKRGLRLSEYGLYRGDEQVAGREEDAIYSAVGLDYIEPELREDKGEIEAAQHHELPKLIELKHIRGDLHTHTDKSDGANSIEEMLDAAARKSYEYYCISDHTKSLTIARGMTEEQILASISEIDEFNSSGRWKMRVLKGAEVDILSNGNLDISDEVLQQLDVVTASVHSKMKDTKEAITDRVCAAIQNRHVDILGHPTGRLLLKRSEYEVDLERVFETARASGVIMELNSHPERLDLNDGNLRAAKRYGLKIAINTDAHRIGELDNMQFGVFQARRGWLEAKDVINTYPLKEMIKLLRK
ncbi:MAG: DNA polymerase/3'-5' exonuclease PolX [Candidatus Thorarchaeota archaeon]|nr:MAG: DNA polymerase/3'-5' exonuclease PolX [Candidatus Thorarchaeota archaeon]